MIDLRAYEYGCFYGKNYDLTKEQHPDKNKLYDIILLAGLTEEDANTRVFSSIEGLFIHNNFLDFQKEHIIKRNEMKYFEKKYNGVFIPFSRKDVASSEKREK
jgi:hypothetical protein